MLNHMIYRIKSFKKTFLTSDWNIEIKPYSPMHTDEFYRQRGWMESRQDYLLYREKENFFDAITNNRHEEISDFIINNPELLESCNDRGLTPLMHAVASKNHDAMKILLSNGANATVADSDGWTAYSWAVFIQDREAQKILSGYTSVLISSCDVNGAVFGMSII